MVKSEEKKEKKKRGIENQAKFDHSFWFNSCHKSVMKAFIIFLIFFPLVINAQNDSKHIKKHITDYIEILPEFPGGDKAIRQFIDSSFYYPTTQNPKLTGTVWIQFRIDTLGKLDSFKVMKGISLLIDKEALRTSVRHKEKELNPYNRPIMY